MSAMEAATNCQHCGEEYRYPSLVGKGDDVRPYWSGAAVERERRIAFSAGLCEAVGIVEAFENDGRYSAWEAANKIADAIRERIKP